MDPAPPAPPDAPSARPETPQTARPRVRRLRRSPGLTRARRLARRLRILAAVIREPGLSPQRLAALAGISESTLFRDLNALRRQGYAISFHDGYQLQESLGLDGPNPATGLAAVYERQLGLLREQVPARLAGPIEAELEAEAPAALAAIVATVIERRLGSGRARLADRRRSLSEP